MSKFIDKTKNFFKEKPVRIIIALIIIASIMTGVAFGIKLLVDSLKTPLKCKAGNIRYKGKSKQGIEYNGICGPKCNKDEEVCPRIKDGKIIGVSCVKKCPNDLDFQESTCNDKQSDYNSYCSPKCPPNDDKHGLHNNARYNKDINKWNCYQDCEQDSNPQGCAWYSNDGSKDHKWCINKGDGPGCESINGDYPNYCPSGDNPKENNYLVCPKHENCIDGKCELKPCGENEIIMLEDGDSCKIFDDSYESADFLITDKNIKVSSCTKNGNFKGLNGGARCADPKKIGLQVNKNKPIYLSDCKGDNIAMNMQMQCDFVKESPSTYNICAGQEEICNNKWQYKSDNSLCVSDQENTIIKNMFSYDEDSNNRISETISDNGYCCKSGHHITGTKNCCNFPINDDGSCYRVPIESGVEVDYDYYSEIFHGPPESDICNQASLDELNTKLYKNIQLTNDKYNILSSNIEDPNYSKFFCDKSSKLKIACGFASQNDNKVIYPYIINSGEKKFYYCDKSPNITKSNERWINGGITSDDVLGCVKGSLKDLNDSSTNYSIDDQLYWYANDEDVKNNNYYATQTYTITSDEYSLTESVGENACEKVIPFRGILKKSYKTDPSNPKSGTCTIDYACNIGPGGPHKTETIPREKQVRTAYNWNHGQNMRGKSIPKYINTNKSTYPGDWSCNQISQLEPTFSSFVENNLGNYDKPNLVNCDNNIPVRNEDIKTNENLYLNNGKIISQSKYTTYDGKNRCNCSDTTSNEYCLKLCEDLNNNNNSECTQMISCVSDNGDFGYYFPSQGNYYNYDGINNNTTNGINTGRSCNLTSKWLNYNPNCSEFNLNISDKVTNVYKTNIKVKQNSQDTKPNFFGILKTDDNLYEGHCYTQEDNPKDSLTACCGESSANLQLDGANDLDDPNSDVNFICKKTKAGPNYGIIKDTSNGQNPPKNNGNNLQYGNIYGFYGVWSYLTKFKATFEDSDNKTCIFNAFIVIDTDPVTPKNCWIVSLDGFNNQGLIATATGHRYQPLKIMIENNFNIGDKILDEKKNVKILDIFKTNSVTGTETPTITFYGNN